MFCIIPGAGIYDNLISIPTAHFLNSALSFSDEVV